MDQNWRNKKPSQFFPDQPLFDEFGRMAGWSLASSERTRKALTERQAAGLMALELASQIVFPGIPGFAKSVEEFAEPLRNALESFLDEFWRGIREYPDLGQEDCEPLNAKRIRQTFGKGDERYARQFEVTLNGCFLIIQRQDSDTKERDGGLWGVAVAGNTSKKGLWVSAIVNLELKHVGPVIVHWDGNEPDRGLAVILAVLRESFGDCVGIRLSEWKVSSGARSEKQHAPSISEYIPHEFEPIFGGRAGSLRKKSRTGLRSDSERDRPLTGSALDHLERASSEIQLLLSGEKCRMIDDLRRAVREARPDAPEDEDSLWDDV